jgi:hypothetical protein
MMFGRGGGVREAGGPGGEAFAAVGDHEPAASAMIAVAVPRRRTNLLWLFMMAEG